MKTHTTKGFTLLETLVAISILSLSIAGAFGVVQSSLSSSIIARDQIIAFQLAQEAIEHVKNVRDTNTFTGATNGSESGWLTGLSQCFGTDCELNIVTRNLTPCDINSGNECKVFKNGTSLYMQGAGGVTPTVFTRQIRLQDIISNKEIKVLVTMSWKKGLTDKIFTIEEHVFNWQKGL